MFSQHEIDTSEVKTIRYEWNINQETKDTTLSTKLTEYKSGFFYEKIEYLKDSSKFGHFFIYKGKKMETQTRSDIENHVLGMGNGIIKIYYDKHKNPDSIVTSIYDPEFKKIFVSIKKRYKRKAKLDYITDLDGKNVYKYNLFGKLKRIEQFRDTVLYKMSDFKNGLLIRETFPTRKQTRKKFIYEYDKKGRMILKDADDYYLFKYSYSDFGIVKSEKIYKKRNLIDSYSLYEYDVKGKLIRKKDFGRKDRLRQEYFYEYK